MAKQWVFFNFLFRRKQYGLRHEGVRQGSLQLALTSKEQNTNPPGSRVFLSLDQFWCTWERLCMNRVRSLLSMRSMLLGYSFEPRPNSRALATGGSVMLIGLSTNGSLHSKKPVWLERTSSNRGQLLWPAACMFINKVSDDVCQWNGYDVVISKGGIFLKNALYVAWHTKKLWAFSDLVAVISAALHETFVRSKYANSASKFLLYWMRIICCIYKDFVRQLKAFFPSFCHSCPCEMSPGWGHLITWIDPSVGHLNGILARVGGNLNNNFKCLRGGGMLKLPFERYIIFDKHSVERTIRCAWLCCFSLYTTVSLLSHLQQVIKWHRSHTQVLSKPSDIWHIL